MAFLKKKKKKKRMASFLFVLFNLSSGFGHLISDLVRFLCFNINLCGLFNAKSIFVEKPKGGMRTIITFPKGISPKVNIIVNSLAPMSLSSTLTTMPERVPISDLTLNIIYISFYHTWVKLVTSQSGFPNQCRLYFQATSEMRVM